MTWLEKDIVNTFCAFALLMWSAGSHLLYYMCEYLSQKCHNSSPCMVQNQIMFSPPYPLLVSPNSKLKRSKKERHRPIPNSQQTTIITEQNAKGSLTLSSLMPAPAVCGAVSNLILTISSAVRNGSEIETITLRTIAHVTKTKPGMK